MITSFVADDDGRWIFPCSEIGKSAWVMLGQVRKLESINIEIYQSRGINCHMTMKLTDRCFSAQCCLAGVHKQHINYTVCP